MTTMTKVAGTKNEIDSRTLQAVLHPSLFEPFPGVDGPEELELAWERRRPWVFASLAHAAYHPGPWVEEKMGRLGASFARAYDRRGAQAFLAVWPDKAVIAFRGTQVDEGGGLPRRILEPTRRFAERVLKTDLPDEFCALLSNDVLADLRFRKKDLGEARVHRGFLWEVRKLWKRALLPDLEARVAAPGIPAYATGHSLGAAMATIAGMLHPFAGVVTFGEPRVGSGVGREFKAGVHTRYVNGDDPVTQVPPTWWPFDYEHHGDEVRVVDAEGPNVLLDHSIVDYAVQLDE